MQNGTCSVNQCERHVRTRGWCAMHYKRWLKHGEVGDARPRRLNGQSLEVKLLSGLQTARPADGSCWEWQGYTKFGYGRIHIDGEPSIGAHRVSYELFVGQIPEGLILRHTCDNRACCNPAHLVPGTYGDNTADMLERGRDCHGEAHPWSKLSAEAVRVARAERSKGIEINELARRLGVDRTTLANAIHGKTWRHVA